MIPSRAPDLVTILCMEFYGLFFKVTWPLKPVFLGQSRIFSGNHEFWAADYRNVIKREDSQKKQSLSATGNVSYRKVCCSSYALLLQLLYTFLTSSPLLCSASLCTKKQDTPWQSWGNNTHVSWPASNPGRYTSLFPFIAPGQTGQTTLRAIFAQASAFVGLCC